MLHLEELIPQSGEFVAVNHFTIIYRLFSQPCFLFLRFSSLAEQFLRFILSHVSDRVGGGVKRSVLGSFIYFR